MKICVCLCVYQEGEEEWMELKVLSFPFYSCSFPEGHLYEIVPSHTPGSGNAMV